MNRSGYFGQGTEILDISCKNEYTTISVLMLNISISLCPLIPLISAACTETLRSEMTWALGLPVP